MLWPPIRVRLSDVAMAAERLGGIPSDLQMFSKVPPSAYLAIYTVATTLQKEMLL